MPEVPDAVRDEVPDEVLDGKLDGLAVKIERVKAANEQEK